jgi:[ribosomal protein S18]-alanine N-acetyltransferase
MIVRRALPTEVNTILALERACAEAPHWSESGWTTTLLGRDEDEEPVRATFVAESGGQVIGFAVVSCFDGVAELENVAVAEAERRRGVGRALCRETIAWSRARGAWKIELEVRASSGGALALYGSLGFRESGRRPEYYRDPMDDAILMSSRLHI